MINFLHFPVHHLLFLFCQAPEPKGTDLVVSFLWRHLSPAWTAVAPSSVLSPDRLPLSPFPLSFSKHLRGNSRLSCYIFNNQKIISLMRSPLSYPLIDHPFRYLYPWTSLQIFLLSLFVSEVKIIFSGPFNSWVFHLLLPFLSCIPLNLTLVAIAAKLWSESASAPGRLLNSFLRVCFHVGPECCLSDIFQYLQVDNFSHLQNDSLLRLQVDILQDLQVDIFRYLQVDIFQYLSVLLLREFRLGDSLRSPTVSPAQHGSHTLSASRPVKLCIKFYVRPASSSASSLRQALRQTLTSSSASSSTSSSASSSYLHFSEHS